MTFFFLLTQKKNKAEVSCTPFQGPCFFFQPSFSKAKKILKGVAKENESHVIDFFLKLIKEREKLPEPLQPIVQNAVVWVTDSQKEVTLFSLLVCFFFRGKQ